MDRSRILPLVGICLLGLVFVLGRLFQIQIVEHDVWAEEAAGLVHTGTVLPYRRGTIYDATGRPLARDVEAYHVVLRYRDFRRGHPLGQVAHARSLLEMRPVSLVEALAELEPWAGRLLALSPTDIKEFARGGELRVGSFSVEATDDPGGDHRGTRASDLHFYLCGLVDPEREHRSALLRARRADEPQPSYLSIVAAERADLADADEAWAEVRARVQRAVDGLAVLAGELGRGEELGATTPLQGLVAELEERRRKVEDDAASRLFSEVAGFPIGRVDADVLLGALDLDWLARLERWDGARLSTWARDARAGWLAWRDGYALDYLLSDLAQLPPEDWTADRAVSLAASVFLPRAQRELALDGRPLDWRSVRELAVLDRVDALVAARAPAEDAPAAARPLAFHADALRSLEGDGPVRWHLFELLASSVDASDASWPAGAHPDFGRTRVGRPRTIPSLAWVEDRLRELVEREEPRFQAAVAEALDTLRDAARPDEIDARGRLRVDEDWLDQVSARMRYLLIDYGNRASVIEDRPAYEAVYLLAHAPERFPGFQAVDARERVAIVLDGEDGPPAQKLVGTVLGADPDDMRRQRRHSSRLRELRAMPWRSPEEQAELEQLLGVVRLADEYRGVSGIEAHWDEVLRGRNGYRESLGLEDLYGRRGGYQRVREPVDGRDVHLTLRADMQRAAEHALEFAARPADPKRDDQWYDHPVGAILVATVEGDVVAAASCPAPWAEIEPGAPSHRAIFERTLGHPDFQPPGSVFKPFVAAWAIDHLDGYDPHSAAECERLPDGRHGYGGVRCWSTVGHGHVDLEHALLGSCNAYFARLGEQLSSADFWRLEEAFGFGRPTGVAQLEGRGGFAEATMGYLADPRGFGRPLELRDSERKRAANGLSVIEATPMQVARAYAGLATGELPRMRLVSRVGDVDVPRRPAEEVGVSEEALARVREAMVGVANDPAGTAYQALREDSVGLRLAVKTGSADLVSRNDDSAVGRKHTWVAGWLPAEDPQYVFVVFVHDTLATSSHGAVYVARDFLLRDEVRAWLEAEGVLR